MPGNNTFTNIPTDTSMLDNVSTIESPLSEHNQEGYLNQLEQNWSNPEPGPNASVTAYRYTGKAIKSSLEGRYI